MVVVVDGGVADLARRHAAITAATRPLAREIEFIYLAIGAGGGVTDQLGALACEGVPITVLRVPEAFGKAAALSAAFREASGDYVLTVEAEPSVDLDRLDALCRAIADADMVVVRRRLAETPGLGRTRKLEWLSRLLLGSSFGDLRCEVRLMRRKVIDELVLYGNQHRFLPLLAQAQGFVVREVELPGSLTRKLRPGIDLGLLLDLLTVYFLTRFVHKPFRFFGGIGLSIFGVGALATGWLIVERLLFDVPLADRPALVLSSLLMVLGIQVVAVGLIGEIVAFAHARSLRDYKIDRIVE